MTNCACGCGETIPRAGRYLYEEADGRHYRPGHFAKPDSLPAQLRAIAGQETKPPFWIWITKEQAPTLTQAADQIEKLETAIKVRDKCDAAEVSALHERVRELEAAVREARARLEKGRTFWNGPCHETAWVLDAALNTSTPAQE